MKSYVIIFLGVMVTDIFYVGYLKTVQANKVFRASCWASTITALGGLIIINYTPNIMSILSAMAGAFVGTYISLKYLRNKS